jgi:glycosyltransferase involved in cell wall biosynthesis
MSSDAPVSEDVVAADTARPLTVLQLVPGLESGGVERGTVEVAQAITAAGGRALVASNGGRLEPLLRRAGGEQIALDVGAKSPFAIARNAREIADIVRKHQVDVIHARSRAPAWAGWKAAQATGTPFITTFHGTYNEPNWLKKRYNSVMARGRPTIAISEFIKGLIQSRYGVADDQIVVIPRGADIDTFAEEMVSTERTIALAQSWGVIEDPRPIVLLPGRLTGWKGHRDMIAATAKVVAMGETDFQVVFAGDDGGSGFGRTLEKEIVEAGLSGQIRMVGHCTDMEAAYKLAAVVVSASTDPEAFGRVSVEAQAMGRPVIASAHGGSVETVDHGKTGWLYPPGDTSALAQAICEALQLDPSGRAHMGVAGRARIRSRFTIQMMQEATLRVYEQASGRTF